MWKQVLGAALVGIACSALNPRQPESAIASVLICIALALFTWD